MTSHLDALASKLSAVAETLTFPNDQNPLQALLRNFSHLGSRVA